MSDQTSSTAKVQGNIMSRWLVRIGLFFLVLGGAIVLGLPDYLPIDLFDSVDPATGRDPFFRVVPADPDSWASHQDDLGIASIAGGVMLAGVGLLLRRRRQ